MIAKLNRFCRRLAAGHFLANFDLFRRCLLCGRGADGQNADECEGESGNYPPISQVNSIFDALRWRFCYKFQYIEVLMEWFAWHTRWVNRNGTAFGSILTAA